MPQALLLLPFWRTERWWHGVKRPLVVTAVQSKISSGTLSKFMPQALLLPPFWRTEPWWHGAVLSMVVAAVQSKISSRTFSKFMPQKLLLLPFWRTEPWWHGVKRPLVVTAVQSKISSRTFSKFMPQKLLLLPFWMTEPWWHGVKLPWWQQCSPRSAQERSASSCHKLCFCCHFGRWNVGDMGWSALWWWQHGCPTSAHRFLTKCNVGKCSACGVYAVKWHEHLQVAVLDVRWM